MDKEIKTYDKEKYLMLIPVITLILIVIGTTYAFLYVSDSDSDTITGSGKCYTVNYTKGNDISGEIEPVADYTSGQSTEIIMYSDPDCASMTGTLYITTNDTSTMDFTDNALRYTVIVDSNIVSEGAVNGTENQVIYSNFTLNTTSTTYTVYIWLDTSLEDTSNSDDESFSGFIHADAVVKSDVVPSPSLMTLTNLGLTDLLNEGTPDFSAIAETDEGIYAAEDDLGTSYYFRGASERNYVYFAGYYWRIIRINGDGSIRMIYDGTSAHDNGESSTDRRITTSAFNSSYSDNAYVGYMYGTAGSSTYAETHANTTDSTIKTYLEDTWYPTLSDDAKSKIVDAIYCNDRSLDTSDSSYTGIGTTVTYYGAYQRLVTNKAPVLICTQEEDRFTYNSANFEIATNGKLEAPVGLITADEVAMAGGVSYTENYKYYLYIGESYWTSSPNFFVGSNAGGFDVYVSGSIVAENVHFTGTRVRSVVSLSSTAITGGNGTKTSPFTTT